MAKPISKESFEKNNVEKTVKRENVTADLYTISEVKVVLDEFLCKFLRNNGCKQFFLMENIRLAIGVVSSLLGVIICYLSMNFTYDIVCKYVTLSVIIYYIINGLTYLLEKNKYYFLIQNNDSSLKFDIVTEIDEKPDYTILVYVESIPIKYSKSIYELFYDDGYLDTKLFKNDLEKTFKSICESKEKKEE
ncbi:hypothetical protein NUSPORA_01374 [Nucleospora cyclopteri]